MTLTFFFSDLEDSSGLADRLGAGYTAVLSEARELQRSAVRQSRRPRGRLPGRRALQRLRRARTRGRCGSRDSARLHGARLAGR